MASDSREWSMPVLMRQYEDIASGKKKVEGRVPDFDNPAKDYRSMEPGDVLIFYAVNPDLSPITDLPECRFRVSFINHYNSIEEMLALEGRTNLLPGTSSDEDAAKTYTSFPGYVERIKKYGVYALGLERCKEA